MSLRSNGKQPEGQPDGFDSVDLLRNPLWMLDVEYHRAKKRIYDDPNTKLFQKLSYFGRVAIAKGRKAEQMSCSGGV